MPTPSTIPPSNAEIEAGTMAKTSAEFIADAIGVTKFSDMRVHVLRAAQIAIEHGRERIAELEHYHRHFTKLAKDSPRANAALDTARREWAKKGEGI